MKPIVTWIFAFVPDRSLPPLEIDREGMRRVIRNLLDNAVAACRIRGGWDCGAHRSDDTIFTAGGDCAS